jgi:Transposase, Mutator family
VSAQTVSRVTQSLDREVARFHKSHLNDDLRYLLLDGVYLRVKMPTVQRKLILCAYGITERGERRLLAFQLATAESQAQWERFLSDLHKRGLHGSKLKLIVTDGCIGLHNALDTVFPLYLDSSLGAQAAKRLKLPETEPAERMSRRREEDLPGGHQAGGRPSLLGLGEVLAPGGAQSCQLLRAGPGATA